MCCTLRTVCTKKVDQVLVKSSPTRYTFYPPSSVVRFPEPLPRSNAWIILCAANRREGGEITSYIGTTWARVAGDRKVWNDLEEGYIQQWIDKG